MQCRLLVSVWACEWNIYSDRVPGCKVESITFFACHISGVIVLVSPFLYDVTSRLASSSPAEDTNRVLRDAVLALDSHTVQRS